MASVKVPPLGESIVEATVSRWLKNEGDAVAPGETVVELETDKITVEVPSMAAGVLTKRLRSEGDVVKVDEALFEVDEAAAPAVPQRGAAGAAAPEDAGRAARGTADDSGQAPRRTTDPRRAPSVERMAAEGVEVSGVQGTGRGGVVSKADVIEQGRRPSVPVVPPAAGRQATPAVSAPPAPPRVPAARRAAGADGAEPRETREPMSTRRKRIAEHLLESQHATAHLTTFNEIDMTAVMGVRERLRDRVEKEHGVKLTFMPFFVKAACLALEAYPVVNAQVDGDSILYKHYVNMGIAVASDAGLVVPNIKDADRKGMIDISRDMTDLARRARDGKLTMADLTGGTFTITNGGVFGSLISTPIINYPQVAILGLHKIQERPVAAAGKVEIRPMMYIALSYDHRIIDGQQAVLFLVRVKELMEDPAAMLI